MRRLSGAECSYYQEQASLKGLEVQEGLTYIENPVKNFGDRRESYSGQKDQDVQNAME